MKRIPIYFDPELTDAELAALFAAAGYELCAAGGELYVRKVPS